MNKPGETTNKTSSGKKSKKKPMKKELQELTELLQRTQASFENFRKQTDARMNEVRSFATQQLITELLVILDNFELAFKEGGDSEGFAVGIKLIHEQLRMVLQQHGLQRMETIGQVFDASKHEAITKEQNQLPEDMILEELQKGYMLGNKVIRYAKVKISAGKNSDM